MVHRNDGVTLDLDFWDQAEANDGEGEELRMELIQTSEKQVLATVRLRQGSHVLWSFHQADTVGDVLSGAVDKIEQQVQISQSSDRTKGTT